MLTTSQKLKLCQEALRSIACFSDGDNLSRLDEPAQTAREVLQKVNPLLCKKCGHNMGRSRVKDGGVRCNNCKQEYTIHITKGK